MHYGSWACCLTLVALGGPVLANDSGIQGTWKAVRSERNGQQTPTCQTRLTISDGMFTMSEAVVIEGVAHVDKTLPNWEIEYKNTNYCGEPDKAEKLNKSIIRIDANTDMMEECFGYGGEVPTDFASKPGSRRMRLVWKRLDGADEADSLVGMWKLVRQVGNGRERRREDVDQFSLCITNEDKNRYRFSKRNSQIMHGAVFINRAERPQQIDFIYSDTVLRGHTVRGIYRITGDRLELCTRGMELERPSVFSTERGDPRWLRVFVRDAP